MNLLSRRDPARPLMTVTGFLGSVQNCSSTGEKASLLLSNYKEKHSFKELILSPILVSHH